MASAGNNTLTGLIPIIYEALDVVPRELVGAIGGVQMDASADMVGLNQTVRSHVVPTVTLSDIVPGVTNTAGSPTTISYVDLTVDNSKAADFIWSGEEQLLLKDQYAGIVRDQFAQAFRTIANTIEASIVAKIAAGASRAVGTAGTTPFGVATDMSDFSNMVRQLDDNGAAGSDRSLIMGTAAAAYMSGKQTILLKSNEAGSDTLLRTGGFDPVLGMNVRKSGQIKAGAAAGTGANYAVASGGAAAGATSITLATGTGTVLAGDVVTIGNFKYVVTAGVSAPGAITIAAPGLQETVAATTAVTVNAASVKNVFLQKAGFVLATRLPAMPLGGDSAADVVVVTDPVSGLSFQLALYRQYRQIKIEIGCSWGSQVIRPEYCGVLLG